MHKYQRWTAVFTPFVLLMLLLAACGQASTPAAPAAEEEAPAAEAPAEEAAAGDAQLEIFSWWTDGGEADGLAAMYEIFNEQHPDTAIVNATIAGGAGANAKTVLKTRLQGGEPPDSWQVHAGKELTAFVDAEQMEPLTTFFAEEGLNDVMPELLLEQITYNGEIWSVPVNIHRSNVMWYNVAVFEENGLEPPTTIEEFFTVAEQLQAAGVTPLAVGGSDKFETPHLFESVLLATLGQEDYVMLFEDPAMWDDPRVAEAATTLAQMLEYANDDRSAIGWADAAQRVLDGDAAMTVMGDWAHGFFLSKGVTPGVEYGYAAAPGTDGVFLWLSDSFGMARNAPNPDAAMAWLRVISSREGQDAFNPRKGSIPARTDADKSLYDEYLTYSIDQFATQQLAPSIVHGAAANEAFMSAYGKRPE
ncbi:MAG: extracellular solute-binding protein, partial [Chloroflexaceae bacterium]|nr:extracellular solute-binding protein [Chloroflexaceae bacterium]